MVVVEEVVDVAGLGLEGGCKSILRVVREEDMEGGDG